MKKKIYLVFSSNNYEYLGALFDEDRALEYLSEHPTRHLFVVEAVEFTPAGGE